MKKPLFRISKTGNRKVEKTPANTDWVLPSNKWSRAVRYWVAEFQQNAEGEARPAFDRVFQATLESSIQQRQHHGNT